MTSIENSLITRLSIGLGLLILSFSFALDYLVSARFEREHDRVIQAKMRSLVTLTKYMSDGLELDFADEFMLEFGKDAKEPSYFQIWTHNEDVLEKSESLHEKNLRKPHFGEDSNVAFDVNLPDGRRGRVLGVRFVPQVEEEYYTAEAMLDLLSRVRQEPVTLVVAEERESLESALLTLHLTLAALGIFALLITATLVRRVVRQGLTPLRDLQAQVATLDTHSLEKRLNSNFTASELIGITDQFNQLLSRLESGFIREKQFSGDVAHELRTPVAEIKSLAEVAIRWPNDESIKNTFQRDVLEASLEMESTINNLLALARSESNQNVQFTDDVNLGLAVNMSLRKLNANLSDENCNIVCHIPETVTIRTVSPYIKHIIDNVVQNAISHCSDDSEIYIDITSNNGLFFLSVSNATEALEQSDLPFIYDRMWRKDKVRQSSSQHSHSGIGLALVYNYCQLLGYTTDANLVDGIFTLSVSGPDRLLIN